VVKNAHFRKYPAESLLFNSLLSEQGRLGQARGNKEGVMKKPIAVPLAPLAICTIAKIKAAVESFDRGEANVFDTLEGIIVAVEAYRTETTVKPIRKRAPREAA